MPISLIVQSHGGALLPVLRQLFRRNADALHTILSLGQQYDLIDRARLSPTQGRPQAPIVYLQVIASPEQVLQIRHFAADDPQPLRPCSS